MPAPFSRIIVIVLDSVGAGALADASAYGDQGSNTLGNIAREVALSVPTLRDLGLDRIVDIGGPIGAEPPRAAIGRMAEASAGKDSVTGHWEMMGIVLDRPFPVFPNGFPKELLEAFERRDRPAHAWQLRGVRDADYRGSRRGAHAHRQAHRLYVGRQRVSDRRA